MHEIKSENCLLLELYKAIFMGQKWLNLICILEHVEFLIYLYQE